MKVQLMVTCLGDVMRPDAGVATVRLLRRLGVEVEFPENQTCCGQPFFNSGFLEGAQQVARHTIQTFEGESLVVTPSGSCGAMVKAEYPHIFQDDHQWNQRALQLASRTFELSDFLVNHLKVRDVGAKFEGRVAYHYACHLRGLGMKEEAETLIKHVQGVEYIPLARQDQCCGFGGSFAVRYPEISGAMVNDKVDCVSQTAADVLVSTDTGCLMNIGGAMHRRKIATKTLHLAELLECR